MNTLAAAAEPDSSNGYNMLLEIRILSSLLAHRGARQDQGYQLL